MRLAALFTLVVILVLMVGCGGVKDRADSGPGKDVKVEDTQKPQDKGMPDRDGKVPGDQSADGPLDRDVALDRGPEASPDKAIDKAMEDTLPDKTVTVPDGPAPDVQNCGNDKVEGSEKCDGKDLDGWTCVKAATLYHGGPLKCKNDCSGFDTTACWYCGDAKVSGKEQCEPKVTLVKQCKDLAGFHSGTLKCTSGCKYDTSGCGSCGNVWEAKANTIRNAGRKDLQGPGL